MCEICFLQVCRRGKRPSVESTQSLISFPELILIPWNVWYFILSGINSQDKDIKRFPCECQLYLQIYSHIQLLVRPAILKGGSVFRVGCQDWLICRELWKVKLCLSSCGFQSCLLYNSPRKASHFYTLFWVTQSFSQGTHIKAKGLYNSMIKLESFQFVMLTCYFNSGSPQFSFSELIWLGNKKIIQINNGAQGILGVKVYTSSKVEKH